MDLVWWLSHTSIFRKIAFSITGHGARIRDTVVIEVSVAAPSQTREIGIVDWRRYADGSGAG